MKQFNAQFSFKTVLLNNIPTLHHNNQTSASQIDHILYYLPEKSEVKVSLHEHLCQLDNSENLSAHDAIIGKLLLPSKEVSTEEPDFSSTYTTLLLGCLVIRNSWLKYCKILSIILTSQNLFLSYLNFSPRCWSFVLNKTLIPRRNLKQ